MSETPLLSRRAFLATGAVVVTGATLSPAVFASETTNELEVTERRMVLPDLPAALQGYRIAQLSDVHLYDGYHPAAIKALDAVGRARADLIVVTGDMWDTPRGAEVTPEFLRALPKGVPIVAILGNHDYGHLPVGATPRSAYDRGGIPLLKNESLMIEHRGAKLALIGLDDLRHGAPDVARAYRDVPEGVTECWLMHEPETLDRIRWPERRAPRFSLLGHTHGGQVRLPFLPAWRPQGAGRYLEGTYDVAGVPAYVSRGIGTSGPRLRVSCMPELPVFTLARG